MDAYATLDWFIHQTKLQQQQILKCARLMQQIGCGSRVDNVIYLASTKSNTLYPRAYSSSVSSSK